MEGGCGNESSRYRFCTCRSGSKRSLRLVALKLPSMIFTKWSKIHRRSQVDTLFVCCLHAQVRRVLIICSSEAIGDLVTFVFSPCFRVKFLGF